MSDQPVDQASRRLAVFIDAENVPPKYADALFDEIAKFGQARVRRIYGNFSKQDMAKWKKPIQRYAIIPGHNYADVAGKNTSDFTLVIDAMDLLYTKLFDGFCLVSSDSDFTRLAQRIRENGLDVFGFGEAKTTDSFRSACDRFIFLENLLPEPEEPNPTAQPPTTKQTENKTATNKTTQAKPTQNKSEAADATNKVAQIKHPPSKAVPLLKKAAQQAKGDDGWASLSPIGQHLHNLAPDFDPRTYSCSNLTDLVEKCGAFEVRRETGKQTTVRLKA